MADPLASAALIGKRVGRDVERVEIVAMLKRAIIEADDKMFRAKDHDARRDFASASVTITRLIDLIECGEHRQNEDD